MAIKNLVFRSFVWYSVFLIATLSFVVCTKKKEVSAKMERDHIIVDELNHAESYFSMHSCFEKAFSFIRQKELSNLSLGKHEIEGNRIFCIVSKGPGLKRKEVRLEAHRKYIDIQYIIAGVDEMGWKQTQECEHIAADYDADKDIIYFEDDPETWTEVPVGSFTIFFPEDAHAPLVGSDDIHKVVLKIVNE